MLIKIFISLGLTVLSNPGTGSKHTDWLDHLIRYIRDESKVYQIIFLIESKSSSSNPIFDDVIRSISINFPARGIDLKDASVPIIPNNDPQTTLYILLYIVNDDLGFSQFVKPINFLTGVSQTRRRPKCLIVLSQDHPGSKYEKLLRFMWSKQFLDVTIVEIVKSDHSRAILFQKDHDENVTIFSYNPFLRTISCNKYSAETEWFPDKLKNLQGLGMQVAWIHHPPDVIVDQTQSGLIAPDGLCVQKLNTLAEHLNFTIQTSPIKEWGKFSCNKDDMTDGVFHGLIKNEIQFFEVEFSVSNECSWRHHEYGKGIRNMYFCLVVPFIQKESVSPKMQWEIIGVVTVISIPLFVWILARLLRFDTRNWRMEYLARIVFGTTVPEEPQGLAERFVFGAILVGCFFYSSVIYTAMTGNEIKTEPSFKFETIEEVLSSDLKIFIQPNVFTSLYKNSQGLFRHVLEKAVQVPMRGEECIKNVMKFQNISCVGEGVLAEWLSQKKRDEFGQPVVRILTHGQFPSLTTYTPLGAGSPYTGRVDVLIQRLTDSGIVSKWKERYMPKKNADQMSKSFTMKKSESAQMIRQILIVPIVGFSISILVFVCEVVAEYILKLN